jgi:hypothetical protein
VRAQHGVDRLEHLTHARPEAQQKEAFPPLS